MPPTIWYVVPCSGSKLDRPATANTLYTGSMHRHTLATAMRSAAGDRADGRDVRVAVLSAEYGLMPVDSEQLYAPYDRKMPKKPAPEYVELLRRQATELGIDWGTAEVYSMLPKAYLAALDTALRDLDVYVQDVYEACGGIFEQRRTNAIVGRPVLGPAGDADQGQGGGLQVWIGADVAGFAWGEEILVNYGRLRGLTHLPVAQARWVLDSRAFTELSQHKAWRFTAEEYAADILRYAAEIGRLEWAAPQDWPAARAVLAATGLTEEEHQRRTVESVVTLRRLVAGRVKVLAVVTGETPAGYLRHKAMYLAAGIDLTREELVGVGALVGRPAGEVAHIVQTLHVAGVTRMHGFGVKGPALSLVGPLFTSTDSSDWSREARDQVGRCPHEQGIAWEANCPHAARAWRGKQRELAAGAYVQGILPLDVAA